VSDEKTETVRSFVPSYLSYPVFFSFLLLPFLSLFFPFFPIYLGVHRCCRRIGSTRDRGMAVAVARMLCTVTLRAGVQFARPGCAES